MEEDKYEKIRIVISAFLVTAILGYMAWAMAAQGIMFYVFGHNGDNSMYVFHAITYSLPIIIGLLVGFIAPFVTHKTFAVVVTTILGIGFIVTDIIVLIRFYTADTTGKILIAFVIGGTILSLLHLNASLFLSRKIRKDVRKRKGE